jgi:hypothetical protein
VGTDRSRLAAQSPARADPADGPAAATPAPPRPAPVAGLVVGPAADPAERQADALAETALARLQRLGGITAGTAPAAADGAGGHGGGLTGPLVIRRSMQDYTNEYDRGYREEFWNGFHDGLDELVQGRVIDRNVVNQIVSGHRYAIQYLHGWDSTYDASANARDHREEGYASGRGAGFDQGYEEALAGYGYARKYSPIPGPNKRVAMGDNGGQCVYCNAAAIADIDHIEPLKVHWQTRGSTMDQSNRSAEANDTLNLVGACANCNRSKGSKRLKVGWNPPGWGARWWPFGPQRVANDNSPPPYW